MNYEDSPEVAALRAKLGDLRGRERGRIHSQIRAQRLKEANQRGTHTADQWESLKWEFDHRCVRCGDQPGHLDRDHIKPIYQGGSNGIDNIQPLCVHCNTSKGPERFNWLTFRRENGFEE